MLRTRIISALVLVPIILAIVLLGEPWLSILIGVAAFLALLELVGLLGHLAVHDLDRDLTVEGLVAGQVDRRHAAASELRLQPVAAGELGADYRA